MSEINRLILGDNLEIMRKMEPESVDLIYLDPPFFSNRNYEVIWGDEGEIRSFVDYWSGGMDQFLMWLKPRVAEMHRLLKPTGSIYLHCDWHANAEIKVYILNKIFGENNFGNEISWIRSNPKSHGSRRLPNCKDTIYFYSKSQIYNFNKIYTYHDEEYIRKNYKYVDENGKRYTTMPLLNPNDNRPNLTYEFLGFKRVWRWTKERMEKAYKEGLIIQTGHNTVPRYKLYLEDSAGKTITDSWVDIENISKREEIGYPTQKPEKLLERIILASSNEGDTVLDPFLGGGTTVVVADRLKRYWIGIDQSVAAVKVTEMRLNKQQGKLVGQTQDIYSHDFSLTLHKYDYDTLFHQDPFEFEKWVIVQFGDKFKTGGIPHGKKGGDKGCDGKTKDGTPIQVKQSENIGINVIKNFTVSAKQYDRLLFEKNQQNNLPCGYIIAFSFGKGAINEAARFLNEENIIIKLIRVDEIVELAKKPKLSIILNDLGTDEKGLKQIEFTAVGESDSGIEFYSWDFDYTPPAPSQEGKEDEKIPLNPALTKGESEAGGFNPSIMLDKDGRQTHRFKPGEHSVAVKAIDNDGLEAMEIIRLKVNGVIGLSEL